MCPLHLTSGCRHRAIVCTWRGRTRWPGHQDVPEIPPTPTLYSSATGSNADLHLETCPGAVITAIKAHGTARTPLALCPQLGVLPSCWFCWVLPHMLSLTPELSAQLDMFLPSLQASFQQRNSSSLYTEFVMHKKRQTSVKLTFTYNFSRDQCLSAYSQEEAF